MLLAASLLLLLLAGLVFWQSARRRAASGLPGGRVIYADPQQWGSRPEEPLYDAKLGLTGRPDYLVEQDHLTADKNIRHLPADKNIRHLTAGKNSPRIIIPVEVKTGRTPSSPRDGHIFQLAAYCLLVERTYGQRPPYGILHYPGRTFAIDFTPELEEALLETLAEMHRQERLSEVSRSHQDPARCARCGFRGRCDERL